MCECVRQKCHRCTHKLTLPHRHSMEIINSEDIKGSNSMQKDTFTYYYIYILSIYKPDTHKHTT